AEGGRRAGGSPAQFPETRPRLRHQAAARRGEEEVAAETLGPREPGGRSRSREELQRGFAEKTLVSRDRSFSRTESKGRASAGFGPDLARFRAILRPEETGEAAAHSSSRLRTLSAQFGPFPARGTSVA